MKDIKSVVVFCASSSGVNPIYLECAKEAGQLLAKNNLVTIYGGAKVGLMGALADAALLHGGKVTGIIPNFMTTHEIAHQGISELILVKSMHERKLLMHKKSDAVITLPGGFGTFEELFEILTWIQLGLSKKPVGILNVNGYYDHLETQLNLMVKEGLLKPKHRKTLYFSDSLPAILSYFEHFVPADDVFKTNQAELS